MYLNKTSLPSKNFYLFTDTALSYTFSKDWVQSWKDVDNQIAQNNVAGKISLDKISDWSGDWGGMENCLHKSNLLINDEIHYDIFNQDWTLLTSNKSFDTSGCPYCVIIHLLSKWKYC